MKLRVKALYSRDFITFEAKPTDTISKVNLRAKMEEVWGLPPTKKLIIIYRGKALEDHVPFKDYSMRNGAILQLILRLRAGKNIFVETHDKKFKIRVCCCSKIGWVKTQIQELQGIPADQQLLSFAGTDLMDDKFIGDYSIEKNDTIQLELRLRGGR